MRGHASASLRAPRTVVGSSPISKGSTRFSKLPDDEDKVAVVVVDDGDEEENAVVVVVVVGGMARRAKTAALWSSARPLTLRMTER